MTLIEKPQPITSDLEETEASKELARLVAEAKARPQPAVNDDQPAPSPPMEDKRSSAQRKADFERDMNNLQMRDRVLLVPTQRWWPNGDITMTVETFAFELRKPSEQPPPKGQAH